VDATDIILEAIKTKKKIKITYREDSSVSDYNRVSRTLSVYLIGILKGKKGTLAIRAFQEIGPSRRNNKPRWRTFAVDKITRIKLLDEDIVIRNDYRPNDRNFIKIYSKIDTEEKPTPTPEKENIIDKIKNKIRSLFRSKPPTKEELLNVINQERKKEDLSPEELKKKFGGEDRFKSIMRDILKNKSE